MWCWCVDSHMQRAQLTVYSLLLEEKQTKERKKNERNNNNWMYARSSNEEHEIYTKSKCV